MWTVASAPSRALFSVATAGAVAFTAAGVGVVPDTASCGLVPSATVVAPVELTALTGDSSLMDLVGALTGLSYLIPILTSPDTPLFPFVTAFEALGEVFFILPLTVAIGMPLLLITEGFAGVQDLFTDLGAVFAGLQEVFDNIMDWYATRNWFTGQLLDQGPGPAVDLSSGWAALPGWEGGGVEDVLTADGFDVVPVDFDLGDLIA